MISKLHYEVDNIFHAFCISELRMPETPRHYFYFTYKRFTNGSDWAFDEDLINRAVKVEKFQYDF